MERRFWKPLLAFSLIVLGVLLILNNIGTIQWSVDEWWEMVYPFLIVLIGLHWVTQAYKGFNGFGTPVFLIIFGSLLILDRLGYITFSFWDVYQLWPLILIFIGLSFLGINKRWKMKRFKTSDYHHMTLGEYKFNGRNWKVEPIYMNHFIGSHTLDFTEAVIPQSDTPIVLHGLAGEIDVILPDTIEFSVKARVKAGEINVNQQTAEGIGRHLTYQTADYDEAEQRLTFDLQLTAGSIQVKQKTS
ncbi:lia operon protein LiaF [Pelagirhabdus alkalitolerans]|uniref:Lia operon protein LiaF n=1 Tax=Pelagirhabdus alkalitolerans TaxID=1612202 RepID=A0A1G6LLZ3_9BACI|nr:cell wall-active antibiotics response protein LiaF [Pelagirhabdus alkalitolerans]SDC44342.1 lia operon protein LiaF [Pelagirhabdus alkalitolerans]